jgi:hypothetical protein
MLAKDEGGHRVYRNGVLTAALFLRAAEDTIPRPMTGPTSGFSPFFLLREEGRKEETDVGPD